MVDAASLPENYFTVWHNVFERGHLAAGEKFLVHGGSSGIGLTAILFGDPGQTARVFGDDVFRLVGRAAIDDQMLDVWIILSQHALDRVADEFTLTVGGSHDRHQRTAALALGLASARLCQRLSVIFVGGLPAAAAGTLGISPIFNRYRFASPMLAEECAAPPPGARDIVGRQRLRVEA